MSMTLTELHNKRGELVTQARAATDEITKNTDDSRVKELEDRSDRIFAELDALDAKIAREQRAAKAEADQEELRAQQRPKGKDGEVRGSEDGDDKPQTDEQLQTEYRAAFDAYTRAGGDLSALDNEQRQLLRRGHQELRTQVAGTNASGGFTVPKDLASEIVKTMKDWGPMYDSDIVRVISTSSGNELDIPTNDDTGNSAAALAEGADPTDDNSGDLVFGQGRLDAYVDATPWIKLSFELVQDSAFDLQGYLGEALGERLGRRANNRLTVGTGTSQPNGIMTASAAGKIAASASAIAPDEVLEFQHSVNAAYRRSPKCRWMFADSTLLVLRKLKDGQGNYLWQMGDVRVDAPDTLLAKPYSINDDIAPIATGARVMAFGDFSRYWVRKVGNPMLFIAKERFYPKIGHIGLIRYDGELVDSAAVKHFRMS